MRPSVARIVELTKPSPEEQKVLKDLGPHAAAPGFRYILDADNEEIIQEAYFYLYALHGKDGHSNAEDEDDIPSLHSNRAAAYELAEWYRFLGFVRRRWDRADNDLLKLYAHLLATRLSYHTGRKREAGTISHKLSTVYGFYTWTNAAGLSDVKWDVRSVRVEYRRAGRDRREACDDKIRPFTPKELKKLLAKLGPLPSKRKKRSTRPTRNRMLFETGLLTGMRGEEICFVRAKAILKLPVDLDKPDETQPLRIRVTKNRNYRWIALPHSLIHELQLYIRGERTEAVDKRLAKGLKDDGFLFVNDAEHDLAGAPLTTQSIHRITNALMLSLRFCEPATRVKNGVTIQYQRTLHSFHDTRHSYAVALYISQRAAGDPKPWETVQKMLGHKDWLTTERYYLRAVGVIEPLIGVRLNRYWE